MTERDPDIARLAGRLGLGDLPYRSFRNPAVRRAPPGSAPSEAPKRPAPVPPPMNVVSFIQTSGAPVLRVVPGAAPPPMPAVARARVAPPEPIRQPVTADAFPLLARATGRALPEPAQQVLPPVARRPAPAIPAGTDFPLLRAALGRGDPNRWP